MIASTWAIPILLAVLTLIGLVVALTGNGWRDAFSWLALAAPIAATGWAARSKR